MKDKNSSRYPIKTGITLIIAFFILTSCYLYYPSQQGSSLVLNFGSLLQYKSLTEDETLIKVYFYTAAESLLYQVQEFPATDVDENDQLTISEVPLGEWKLLVAVGAEDSNDVFTASKYIEVDVSVTQSETPDPVVPASWTNNPFTFPATLSAKDVKGIVRTDDGNVFAATEDTVYEESAGIFSAVSMPSDFNRTINSLSPAKFHNSETTLTTNGFFINTNKGIVTFDGNNPSPFNTDFSVNLVGADGTKEITRSGAFYSESVDPNALVVFYQSANELGGGIINDGSNAILPDQYSWVGFSLSETAGLLQENPILDLLVTDSFAYIASKLGTFGVPYTLFAEGGNFTIDDILTEMIFISDPAIGAALVLSIAYNDSTNKIYLGAQNGVWRGVLNESPDGPDDPQVIIENITRIPGTKGINASDVEVSLDGGYAAFISKSRIFILKIVAGAGDSATYTLFRFPFLTDKIGNLKTLTWGSADGLETGTPILFVAGSEGIALLNTDTID